LKLIRLLICMTVKVGVMTVDATNLGQLSATDFVSKVDRSLRFEVWYPAAEKTDGLEAATYQDVTRSGKPFELTGTAFRNAPKYRGKNKFPLVVLSHGYTGYRSMMFYLAEHLASHGYIVVAIDHTDSTNADVDFEKDQGSGFVSTLLNRARDQQFALEFFAGSESVFTKIVDAKRAALIGHSMGGFGALNTVGACYDFTPTSLGLLGIPEAVIPTLQPIFNSCNAGHSAVDPRWKAMIAFAPWGGELNVHQPKSLAAIETPMLFVAGDQDDISGYEQGVKKLYQLSGKNNNYLMVYQGARHNIAGHPAPRVAFENEFDLGHYFEPSWSIENLNRINKHMGLAFLDCYVKQLKAACDFLPQREDITQSKQADGALTPAWPGFPERWGTGVRFYRKQ